MISKKICNKVKLERSKKGFSQEELAFRAGVNKNTIWKIETGQVSPNISTLEKIAKALDLDFLYLVDVSKVDL
ncbi:MAG: helix-turn-helix transcriptional regulator [Cyanobacteria bacterium SIG26]|nr:helix-turn-helix transcriptional regulator [Cyanobacteria bacterium SIG26]